MDADHFYSLLQNHVPPPAVAYCFRIWQEHPFEFKLRKARASKIGDFSCRPGKVARITVNHDSHPYLFLLTYIHEVAHLVVHRQSGWSAEAHGTEWKSAFNNMLRPLMTNNVFPEVLLKALDNHMINPKASSFSDAGLSACLRQYDERLQSATLLSQIPEGSLFGIRGRWFMKGQQKRTRIVCHEVKTRRKYLVSADAQVEVSYN